MEWPRGPRRSSGRLGTCDGTGRRSQAGIGGGEMPPGLFKECQNFTVVLEAGKWVISIFLRTVESWDFQQE